MTEDVKSEVKKDSPICIGLDVGTMNLVCARSDTNEIKITRNVFLSLDRDDVQISELSDINYIEADDGDLFIIGSDAFKYANIFGQKVSRPMEKGLISPREIAAIDVLTLMIRELIGDVKTKEAYCSYSIPAESIGEGRSVTYHENVFARILKSLGVNYTSVNEAMAIIYSECAKEKFSGIAISFGAGMANCLTGETKIPLLDGTTKTLEELTDEYDGDKFWVYSCKEDGSIVPGLAHSPRKTGTKKVIRIHLDNESYFDCTEDHLIMKRDGTYIEAGKLKENDSLMPLYTETGLWNEMPGYLSCYNNKHRHWEMVHNMVIREEFGIYRKKNYITHHKNFNKIDNRPENLTQCTKKEHFDLHKEICSMGGKVAAKVIRKIRYGKTNEEIYGEDRSKEISKNISIGVLNSTSSDTIRKQRHNKNFEEIFGEEADNIKKKMSLQKKNKTYEEIMSDENLIEERKKELSIQCYEQQPWKFRKSKINEGTFKKNNIPWNKGLKGEEYKKHFKEGMKNQYVNPINHKVIKIEHLNIYRDVYDLTVDRYHNFAINNGIFVHNCAIAYKGIKALAFSTARAGDWIDNEAAVSLGMVVNRVTSIKEKYMQLSGAVEIKNKKTKRVLEALYYYHKALIDYTVKEIIKEFNEKVDIEVDESIPIIISGGTSIPKGFVELFKDVISGYDLPFELSEIRQAKNPLTAVANGLLVRTMSDVKGMK